eukprot:3793906-Rhodomonas_salina.1
MKFIIQLRENTPFSDLDTRKRNSLDATACDRRNGNLNLNLKDSGVEPAQHRDWQRQALWPGHWHSAGTQAQADSG